MHLDTIKERLRRGHLKRRQKNLEMQDKVRQHISKIEVTRDTHFRGLQTQQFNHF
jgi:hypothetical protein